MNDKKKKNKNIVFYIIGIIILIGIFILFISIINGKKEASKNMAVIRSSYTSLSESVNTYNEIRTELGDLLNNFMYDSFNEEQDKYKDIFIKYDEVIKKIDSNISNIDDRCNYIYSDNEVNKICNNYKGIYEKLINLYINDIDNYNNKVSSYNEYSNSDIELVSKLYDDYIDYNKDGIYEGKDISNEEDKEEK